MNPLPPVQVHTGPPAGDSSLSSQNDEEENRSVNSAKFSNYSQSDIYAPNPEELYMTNITNEPIKVQYQHEQAGTATPTPRHSNRIRTHPNSEAVGNTSRTTNAPNADLNVNGIHNFLAKELTIRITARPIMSWSPQVIHADGTSHTMTIDLPQEFSGNNSTIVITQQGWQRLYHIVATAVTKNTSESILLFWFSGFLLIVMALVMLFGLVKGISARLTLLLVVLGVTSLFGIGHTIVRRIRVHVAVRKCVEECFYDAEAEAAATAAAAIAALSTTIDLEQAANDNNASNNRDTSMSGVLDGLQELEDAANGDLAVTVGETSGGGFGRALRQRLNSHSSTHSHTNSNSNAMGNRQRLDTGGVESTVSSSSNMIFNEEGPRRNRAVSRDGMYCVNWKWEFLGMDAVVKITWE